MDRYELEKSWAVTRQHLEEAERVLSSLHVDAVQPMFPEFKEYLRENELGLALDVLTEIGEAIEEGRPHHCPDHFWDELARAASNMKLDHKAEQLRSRKQNH